MSKVPHAESAFGQWGFPQAIEWGSAAWQRVGCTETGCIMYVIRQTEPQHLIESVISSFTRGRIRAGRVAILESI